MQANARITSVLSAKQHTLPISRATAMRDALEAVLLHGALRMRCNAGVRSR